MTPNTGENRRIGALSNRSRVENPVIWKTMRFNINTGGITVNKEDVRFKKVREIRRK